MRYSSYEVCAGKECSELVPVKKFTKDKVYCEKCAKKQKKK